MNRTPLPAPRRAALAAALLLLAPAALPAALPDAPLINVQCEGDTANTGTRTLTGPDGEAGTGDDSHNGLLSDWAWGASIINVSTAFNPAWNPAGQGVDLSYHPYVPATAANFPGGLPKAWTLTARLYAPEYADTVILAIGDGRPGAASLVLATGAIQENEPHNDSDRGADELCLWLLPAGTDYQRPASGATKLASQKVPCLTDSFHLISVRYDNGTLALFLNDRRLFEGVVEGPIAPGLQFGQLLAEASGDFTDGRFEPVGDLAADDGVLDFLLFYDRALDDATLHALARAYPYVHKDENGWNMADGDYPSDIRYVRRLAAGQTADWVQENAWVRQYSYQSWGATYWWPDLDGDSEANEPDYRYAEPAEGAIVLIQVEGPGTATLRVNPTRGGFFPAPDRTYAQLAVEGPGTLALTPCDAWATARDPDAQALAPDRADGFRYGALTFTGGAGQKLALQFEDDADAAAAHLNASATLPASVCDLSNADVLLGGEAQVTFLADAARVRGLAATDRAIDCRLAGQLARAGQGSARPVANPADLSEYGQASQAVYVAPFDPDADDWLITDVSERVNPEGPRFADALVARYAAWPIPLYLTADTDAPATLGAALPWRRHGFDGEQAPAADFAHAQVLHIRPETTTEPARLHVTESRTIRELHVESAQAASEVLILPQGGALTVSDALRADCRLEVYGGSADGVCLGPAATLSGAGVFAAGAADFDHALGETPIAAIESLGTLTFSAAQTLPGTTLAVADGAALELAGYVQARALEPAGAATLRGEAGASLAVGEATGREGASLTLEGADWIFAPGSLGGLPLRKAGAGAVTVPSDAASFGPIAVAGGTLRVPHGVGREGVAVAAGATLSAGDTAAGTLVAIPAGQTLSGAGRIEGTVALAPGSTLDVAAGALSVQGVEAAATVSVALPEGAEEGHVFLKSDEAAPDWASRAAFEAKDAAGEQWGIRLQIQGGVTAYALAALAPDAPDGAVWPEAFEDALAEACQAETLVGGAAEGLTRAATRRLSAGELAEARRCFEGVSALARRSAAEESMDYRTADWLMAYEFGISALRVTEGEALVEVTLRNALGEHFAGRAFVEAGAETQAPAYAAGTVLVFSLGGVDVAATEVEGGAPAVGTSLSRWFAIPREALGAGGALSVRAVPGAE